VVRTVRPRIIEAGEVVDPAFIAVKKARFIRVKVLITSLASSIIAFEVALAFHCWSSSASMAMASVVIIMAWVAVVMAWVVTAAAVEAMAMAEAVVMVMVVVIPVAGIEAAQLVAAPYFEEVGMPIMVTLK
jgi:hypothetical protein